jgi:hypothetical protein
VYADDGNLYCHHDITLPDFPICLSWMDCPPFQQADGTQMEVGNYIAVGTFNPAIEIWNLDVLGILYYFILSCSYFALSHLMLQYALRNL